MWNCNNETHSIIRLGCLTANVSRGLCLFPIYYYYIVYYWKLERALAYHCYKANAFSEHSWVVPPVLQLHVCVGYPFDQDDVFVGSSCRRDVPPGHPDTRQLPFQPTQGKRVCVVMWARGCWQEVWSFRQEGVVICLLEGIVCLQSLMHVIDLVQWSHVL